MLRTFVRAVAVAVAAIPAVEISEAAAPPTMAAVRVRLVIIMFASMAVTGELIGRLLACPPYNAAPIMLEMHSLH
jgi:hypothetical protein